MNVGQKGSKRYIGITFYAEFIEIILLFHKNDLDLHCKYDVGQRTARRKMASQNLLSNSDK